mmetsp:Transcript_23356/g.63327  ORF Transcript_23356/g.63327 Transcript_23356/m.63327 type:complete len:213 (+) Transcript_23356:936-1574(+)
MDHVMCGRGASCATAALGSLISTMRSFSSSAYRSPTWRAAREPSGATSCLYASPSTLPMVQRPSTTSATSSAFCATTETRPPRASAKATGIASARSTKKYCPLPDTSARAASMVSLWSAPKPKVKIDAGEPSCAVWGRTWLTAATIPGVSVTPLFAWPSVKRRTDLVVPRPSAPAARAFWQTRSRPWRSPPERLVAPLVWSASTTRTALFLP